MAKSILDTFESRIASIARSEVTTNIFAYNGLYTRISKVDSTTGGTMTFKRAGAGVTAPVLSDGQATYTPGISESRGTGTPVTTNSHPGIKSAETQSSTSQVIGATKNYDAFGNLDSSSGTWKGPFGYGGPFGYQQDPDHGLKLLGHRYYDSSTGRFLTRDPVKEGRNWYLYCKNNPLTFVDPNGQFPWSALGITTMVHNESSEAVIVVGDYVIPGSWPSGKLGAIILQPGEHSPAHFDVDGLFSPSTGYWEPNNFAIPWDMHSIVAKNGIPTATTWLDSWTNQTPHPVRLQCLESTQTMADFLSSVPPPPPYVAPTIYHDPEAMLGMPVRLGTNPLWS